MTEIVIWLGITLCLTQSAMFSGLNLAVFSLNRLNLEVEVAGGNLAAQKVLDLRSDSNFVLTTILWGNVGINVLLTLLSDSVLAGVAAFAFSTILITICGEIAPQAYFSRNALKMATLLAPVLGFYQLLLFPVAKPSALVLDAWLGREAIQYFREQDLKEILRRHMLSEETEVDRIEAIGAMNFLAIDDLPIEQEGVPLDPESIIRLPTKEGMPLFPDFGESTSDHFLRQVEASGKPWVIIVDEKNMPRLVLDADGFLRHALFRHQHTNPYTFCHRPVVVRDRTERLGDVIMSLRFDPHSKEDNVITYDVILIWDDNPRVVTGTDLLGGLMRGIVEHASQNHGKFAGELGP
jgi:metal transporter CNNM